jgi:hypothetical protein
VGQISLVYLASRAIVRYITAHPIAWKPRDLAKLGGPGDQAGMTPTPAVEEFLGLLATKQDLFTQAEYTEHCVKQWLSWWEGLPDERREGVTAKLYNNFYVSMIDSLHVWALLVEAGWYDRCVVDSVADAVGKSDLTLYREASLVRLALIGPGQRARDSRTYKRHYRPGEADATVYEVQLSAEYPREPGHKRWYRLENFAALQPADAEGLVASSLAPLEGPTLLTMAQDLAAIRHLQQATLGVLKDLIDVQRQGGVGRRRRLATAMRSGDLFDETVRALGPAHEP